MNAITSYLFLFASSTALLILVISFWTNRFKGFLKLDEENVSKNIFLIGQMVGLLFIFSMSLSNPVLEILQELSSTPERMNMFFKHFSFILLFWTMTILFTSILTLISVNYLFKLGTTFNTLMRDDNKFSVALLSCFFIVISLFLSQFILNPIFEHLFIEKSAFVPISF